MNSISLTDFQNAIKDKIKEHIPKVTVDSYDSLTADISENAPACLLELEQFDFGTDKGDDRYPSVCRISIHCILGFEVTDRALQLREFALKVAQLVRKDGIWIKDKVMTRPTSIEAYPGKFSEDTDKSYDSWVVTWEQTVYLGESLWTIEGSTPQDVYYAFASDGKVQPEAEHLPIGE